MGEGEEGLGGCPGVKGEQRFCWAVLVQEGVHGGTAGSVWAAHRVALGCRQGSHSPVRLSFHGHRAGTLHSSWCPPIGRAHPTSTSAPLHPPRRRAELCTDICSCRDSPARPARSDPVLPLSPFSREPRCPLPPRPSPHHRLLGLCPRDPGIVVHPSLSKARPACPECPPRALP